MLYFRGCTASEKLTGIQEATEKLLKQGYTNVHNLGGLKNAQEKLDLPVRK